MVWVSQLSTGRLMVRVQLSLVLEGGVRKGGTPILSHCDAKKPPRSPAITSLTHRQTGPPSSPPCNRHRRKTTTTMTRGRICLRVQLQLQPQPIPLHLAHPPLFCLCFPTVQATTAPPPSSGTLAGL